MLNEGWDEYFAKSHSQFEPNAEEMFGYSFVSGDVISKDKECVGGVCSGGIPDTFGKTFSASNLGLYGLNSYHGSGGDDFRFSFSHFHHGIAKNLAEVYLAGYHDIDLLGFDFDKSTNKVTPMIEFVVRNAINIPELKHGFTIFTFSDGSQIIIAGYPENHNVLKPLEAVVLPYTEEYEKQLGEDLGKYKKATKKYSIVYDKPFTTDQELVDSLYKTKDAIKYIETGDEGRRYPYYLCLDHDCRGVNCNTVQKEIYRAMGLDEELDIKIKESNARLPGIDSRFDKCYKYNEYYKNKVFEYQKFVDVAEA